MTQISEAMATCLSEGTALAAFNAPGFDAMVGIGRAAYQAGRPVIIQVSARLVKKNGALTIKAWFDTAVTISGATCFLHLDHCDDEALIGACINEGWDMVMFDGSQLSIDENCTRTARVVQMAHAAGVAVEAEVGSVGGEEDGHEAEANIARLSDIVKMATQTGIDCIAVGFGNLHGDYKGTAHLRWDVYESAHRLGRLPLVLHGGSGLSESEFRRAIRAGSTKINISTELKKAYALVTGDADLCARINTDPAVLHCRLEEAAQRVAFAYITLFATTK